MAARHRICSAPSLSTFEPNLDPPEDDEDCAETFDEDMCQGCGADIDEMPAGPCVGWKCAKACGWFEGAA